MTKNEMKDKISMALKDPILQIGFEVICSKLSRLEKENAELDCQMNRNKYCHSCVNATDRCFRKEVGCPCEKYKSYKDENAELEKENAELKSKNCWKTCEYAEPKSQLISQHIQDVAQLSKAKEIIKDYMIIAKGAHTTVCGIPEENRTINVLKLNEEAEQFLKEVYL